MRSSPEAGWVPALSMNLFHAKHLLEELVRERAIPAGTKKRNSFLPAPSEEVGRPLRIPRGPDDIDGRAVPDVTEPPCDIGSLVIDDGHIDPGHRTQEGRTHLRRQLLAAVLLAPEPDRPGYSRSLQAGFMTGPVSQFMEVGRVVFFRRFEPLHLGHVDDIRSREICRRSRGDLRAVPFDHFVAGRDRPDLADLFLLDPFALREVEDPVIPDKRLFPLRHHKDLVALVVHNRPCLFEGPEDNKSGCLLAFPDIPAELLDLPVRPPPFMTGEQKAVYAPVGPSRQEIARRQVLPRLMPGDRPRGKRRDDPFPDHLIDIYHQQTPLTLAV